MRVPSYIQWFQLSEGLIQSSVAVVREVWDTIDFLSGHHGVRHILNLGTVRFVLKDISRNEAVDTGKT